MTQPIAQGETVQWTDYTGASHLGCRVLERRTDAGLYHLETPSGPQWAIAEEVERANPGARREA